jgi:hypothetical protein
MKADQIPPANKLRNKPRRVMIPSFHPTEMTGLGDSRSPFAGVED